MARSAHSAARASSRQSGFTLLELMVVVALLGIGAAIIMPNLGALVPSARLQGSAKQLSAWLETMRSEARIQAKRMELELDLEPYKSDGVNKCRYRIIWPPEERLTTDQIVYDDDEVDDEDKDWIELEDNVVFEGAGVVAADKERFPRSPAKKGRYRVTYDEYGFTADQVIALRLLENDQKSNLVLTLSIRGLSGKIDISTSEDGEIRWPEFVTEGAFR